MKEAKILVNTTKEGMDRTIEVKGSEALVQTVLCTLPEAQDALKMEAGLFEKVACAKENKGSAAKEERKEAAPARVESDVVVIYDNAGIPSIMRRCRKKTNAALFEGGSDKTHPAFVIGGEEYDEIYIGVYEGCEIGGRIYSLPYRMPKTNVTMDDFAKMCFAKGEGWHMMTAQEWGLVANECAKAGVFPHGNTEYGHWHKDEEEKGIFPNGYDKGTDVPITLTGSGPATWTHNHQPDGVHDLCGNIWEMLPGVELDHGVLGTCAGNDMATPEGWKEAMEAVKGKDGKPVRIGLDEDENMNITTDQVTSYGLATWGEIETAEAARVEELREIAMWDGEKNAIVWADTKEPERCLCRGGGWGNGSDAGVFAASLDDPRSNVSTYVGGRVAYFKKH